MNEAAIPPAPRRRRHVFDAADWWFYSRMLRAFESKPGHRLAYDRGRLEILGPTFWQQVRAERLKSLVWVLAEELQLPLRAGGSVTIRRRRLERGIEADGSFWVRNAARLAGATTLNLKRYPPPDLCLEVDAKPSRLNRLRIYESLGVPEVWTLEGERLRFHVLVDGRLIESAVSGQFSNVAAEELGEFARGDSAADDHIAVIHRFRMLLRQRAGK